MGIIKVCAEIGKKGIMTGLSSLSKIPVFHAADAFELKRNEHLPILYGLKNSTLLPMQPDQQKLQEILDSGKELIFHGESTIDQQNWHRHTVPLADGKDTPSILQDLGISFASFHIGGSNKKYFDRKAAISAGDNFDNYNLVQNNDYDLFLSRFMEIFSQRVQYIKQGFSGDIAFENLPNIADIYALDYVWESRLINEVFNAHPDLFFLLDIAHASVSCARAGINIEDYINSFPLNRIAEIHISQPDLTPPEKAFDTHKPPTYREFRLLEYVLAKGACPRFVTVEFFRDDDLLLQSIQKTKEIVSK